MALATYDDLVDAVGDWLARDDLAGTVPDFIVLAEARLNRELRCREMVTRAQDTVSTQELTIPSDFIETVRLVLDTASDAPLEYRPIEDSELRIASVNNGTPRWFTVLGGVFRFYPIPDGAYDYTLDYYRTIPPLTAQNQTNWLMTKAPDAYLYGALVAADTFLQNDDRLAIWEANFQAAKHSLLAAEARTKRTNQARRSRILV